MTYRELVLKTKNDNLDYNQTLTNAAMGLTGEAGEVCDYLKKVLFHGKPLDKSILLKEIGDCFWYLELLMLTIGTTDEEVKNMNIQKLLTRYPNGFNKEDAEKRVDIVK